MGDIGVLVDWPNVSCQCFDDNRECICPPMEKALRAWQGERITCPMSSEQRESCLHEIGQVEGYDRADHETDKPADLARATLGAWVDYCRDKGLL